MAGVNAIRGSRVGAGPMGEAEKDDTAPRFHVSYYCTNGHKTRPTFVADVMIPESWGCPRCGLPANTNAESPPPPPKVTPYKTHLAYVKERHIDAKAVQTLGGAVPSLRTRRAAGEVLC